MSTPETLKQYAVGILIASGLFLGGFATGFGSHWLVNMVDQPLNSIHCPTEDSCRPEYSHTDKQWHIEEVTP